MPGVDDGELLGIAMPLGNRENNHQFADDTGQGQYVVLAVPSPARQRHLPLTRGVSPLATGFSGSHELRFVVLITAERF